MFEIRNQTPPDESAVSKLVENAFAKSEFGHNGEAVITRILSGRDDCYCLVAVDNNEIVGQISFSPVEFHFSNDINVTGMGLGPMCVSPELQNKGVGSQLVRKGIRLLSQNGVPFVVVLGHPEYYPRFGFELAERHGISHGFAGIPQHVFFIHIIEPDFVQSNRAGRAFYRPEFGAQWVSSNDNVSE